MHEWNGKNSNLIRVLGKNLPQLIIYEQLNQLYSHQHNNDTKGVGKLPG